MGQFIVVANEARNTFTEKRVIVIVVCAVVLCGVFYSGYRYGRWSLAEELREEFVKGMSGAQGRIEAIRSNLKSPRTTP
jgi:hypothetical protein